MCESAPSIVIVRHDFRPLRKVRRHHLVTEPLSCGVTTWQCHPSQPKLTSQPFRKGDKNVQTLQLNPICFLAHPQNPHEPNFGKGVFLPTKKNTKPEDSNTSGAFKMRLLGALAPLFSTTPRYWRCAGKPFHFDLLLGSLVVWHWFLLGAEFFFFNDFLDI